MAYHAHLDRLRAERSLDAAQAASVPHLSKEGHKSWYRHTQKRTARRAVAARVTGEPSVNPIFTVNGQEVGKDGLARWLAQTFGLPMVAQVPSRGATRP